MVSNLFTRRDFPVRLASFFSGLGVVGTAFGSTSGPRMEWSVGSEEISRSGEAIHQEVVFKGSRKRVYEALTDTEQFNKVTQLSAAMHSGMPPGAAPTEINREVGGSFRLFGGHIVGRQVELVPNERIVQAWRVVTWDPGVYSIARFELKEQGSETRLVFDHAAFPDGKAEHLAAGWKTNYWEPLHKYLSFPNGA
jgi:activator of HSP90 ATPase